MVARSFSSPGPVRCRAVCAPLRRDAYTRSARLVSPMTTKERSPGASGVWVTARFSPGTAAVLGAVGGALQTPRLVARGAADQFVSAVAGGGRCLPVGQRRCCNEVLPSNRSRTLASAASHRTQESSPVFLGSAGCAAAVQDEQPPNRVRAGGDTGDPARRATLAASAFGEAASQLSGTNIRQAPAAEALSEVRCSEVPVAPAGSQSLRFCSTVSSASATPISPVAGIRPA